MRSMPFIPGLLLISLLSVSLAGCGTFRDRSHDYRRAQTIEPLVLPDGMADARLGDSYAVPGLESHRVLPARFEVPRPDPLRKDMEQGVVRVQRLGDERWILVEGTPGQLWPRLRGFISLARMSVARTDAERGVIETGWLQPAGSDERERYRFRIEQGVQRATSEIYLLHASAQTGEQWPERSSSPEREEEITMALAQYLADTDVMGSVSMLAERGSDVRGRVFLADSPEFGPHIRLHLNFDRSWAALPLAMEKAGFNVEDRNRAEGRYWVGFVDPDQREPGRLRRLFGGSGKTEPALYWVDAKAAPNKEREVIITIQAQDGEGEALTEAEQVELLKRIKGFIS